MDTESTNTLWRIRLFNGPILEDSAGNEVRRFRSQRVGALLAFLALHLGRPCPREELYEALWPEEDILVSANRLRVTLTSLRKQMEPGMIPFGTVLDVSVPGQIRLLPESVWCDTDAFERAFKSGNTQEAAALATGSLLPGYYDEWILDARSRFEALADDLTRTDAVPSVVFRPTSVVNHSSPVTQLHESTDSRHPTSQLPLYLTRFFGRQRERHQLLEIIETNRLVTITGIGGMGKTRLAIETARERPWQSVFVPLADLPDAQRLPEAALQALGVLPQPDADGMEQLARVLSSRGPILLIVDNAEHLVDAVAALSQNLLQHVPDLRLLVTSRQRLNLAGEAVVPLMPLEPPPYSATPERLIEFPSVALFADRARSARPDFVISERHAAAVVEICLMLEGMPLALELAAARVTAQTPAQIAESLVAGLTDLKSRQRGLSERHRSLRAAMQGSLDLLTDELQAFFAALSVFQGGWTAEAARDVTATDHAEDYLEDLIHHSLVLVKEDDLTGCPRYTFLEPIRQFAVEILSNDQLANLTSRHAAYYLKIASPLWEDDVRLLVQLDGEEENLRRALEVARSNPDAAYWNGLIGALMHAFVRGRQRVAINWVEDVLPTVPDIPDREIRFRLQTCACMVLCDLGRYDEVSEIARALEHDAMQQGEVHHAVSAKLHRGYVANDTGHYEDALRIQRSALSDARIVGDQALIRRCEVYLARALMGYASTLAFGADYALELLDESERMLRALIPRVPSYSRQAALVQLGLGVTLLHAGRPTEAYSFIKDAQRTALENQNMALLMFGFYYESALTQKLGILQRAALLYGAVTDLRERMGYSYGVGNAVAETLADLLRRDLGIEEYESLNRQGRRTPHEFLVRHNAELITVRRELRSG